LLIGETGQAHFNFSSQRHFMATAVYTRAMMCLSDTHVINPRSCECDDETYVSSGSQQVGVGLVRPSQAFRWLKW
jgi:hypothetical protein